MTTLRQVERDEFLELNENVYCKNCNHKILEHESFFQKEGTAIRHRKRSCSLCLRRCKSDWVGAWIASDDVLRLSEFEASVVDARNLS